jgi:DNA-binding LytR/AlgR family response regulator
MVKTFIIDDEPNAAKYLKSLLEHNTEIDIIGLYTSALEALSDFKTKAPDLVFTDIEMPDLNGIYLAEQLLKINPHCNIVFTTAYDEYAIEAFEINALDYLLKPISTQRLNQTLSRIVNKSKSINPDILEEISTSSMKPLGKIVISQDESMILIDINDISYFESRGKEIHIHTSDCHYTINKTLSYYEKKLVASNFYRCHKSYLINLNKLVKLSPTIGYSWNAYLEKHKEKIPVSRSRVGDLKELLAL